MINKRIAISAISILTTLSLMGGATFAYFSDQGTSSTNTFSTGTLDLKLTDSNETDQDNVSLSFGSTTLVPGTIDTPAACTGDQTLTLKNTGTVAADHAEVDLANVVTDNGTAANPDIDYYLRIKTLTYDGADVTAQIVNSNANAFLDLADWAASATALDSLSLTNLNTGHPLVLNVCLDSSAPNEIQGDSLVATFTVDLNQHSSQ